MLKKRLAKYIGQLGSAVEARLGFRSSGPSRNIAFIPEALEAAVSDTAGLYISQGPQGFGLYLRRRMAGQNVKISPRAYYSGMEELKQQFRKADWDKPAVFLNRRIIKEEAEIFGLKYSTYLKRTTFHEKFHLRISQAGVGKELHEKFGHIVPESAKDFLGQTGYGSDKITEEYFAHYLTVRDPRTKRLFQNQEPAFQFLSERFAFPEAKFAAIFSGKDDAYNVIEGLGHKGISPQLRKVLTDFGSGWRGLVSHITKRGKNVMGAIENYMAKTNVSRSYDASVASSGKAFWVKDPREGAIFAGKININRQYIGQQISAGRWSKQYSQEAYEKAIYIHESAEVGVLEARHAAHMKARGLKLGEMSQRELTRESEKAIQKGGMFGSHADRQVIRDEMILSSLAGPEVYGAMRAVRQAELSSIPKPEFLVRTGLFSWVSKEKRMLRKQWLYKQETQKMYQEFEHSRAAIKLKKANMARVQVNAARTMSDHAINGGKKSKSTYGSIGPRLG